MKTILYKTLFILMFCFYQSNAQITISRTPDPIPTIINSCQTVTLNYSVTVNNGPYNSITINEQFMPQGGCPTTPLNPRLSNLPSGSIATTSNGFNITINNTSAGSSTYVFQVSMTINAPPQFESYQLCVSGITASSVPAASISVSPSTQQCFTIENKATWRSSIDCVEQTGVNCFLYTVNVKDLSSSCDANMYGTPRFEFSVPGGGIINGVTSNATLANIVNGGNTIAFSSTTNTWIQNSTREKYTFEVQYPCSNFPSGTNVTAQFDQINNSVPTNTNYGQSCPSGSGGSPIAIGSSNTTLQIEDPTLDATVEVKEYYDSSKNTPGCANKAYVEFTNIGNTIIDDVFAEVKIPSTIEITNLCAQISLITGYRLAGQPWQYGVPSTAQFPQLIGLRYKRTTDINAPRLCNGNKDPEKWVIPLCYRIKPSVAVGTDIKICANLKYTDKVGCTATSCPPYAPHSGQKSDCLIYPVVAPEAKPRILKSITNASLYPGNSTSFIIEIANSGSGDLTTTMQDIIPNDFQNISISAIQYSAAGAAYTTPPTGVVTSQSVTGNAINVGLNIPGICTLGGSCCSLLENKVRIRIDVQVKDCIVQKTGMNTARLQPQNETATRSYAIRNYNRLDVQKFAKGDMASSWTSGSMSTTVSPGGNIDYKITIKNNDPYDWNDLVISDILPYTTPPDVILCTSVLRASQFDVALRAPVTVSLNAAASAVTSTVSYTNTIMTTESDLCGGTATINSGFSVGDRGFKVKFNDPIPCGAEITINIPAKVMGNPSQGAVATNSASFVTSNNSLLGYATAAAEIQTWQLDCCDQQELSLSNFQVLTYEDGGTTHNRAAINLDLSSLSNIPVQKIRLSVIDFEYDQNFDDCKVCHNSFRGLGTFPGNSDWAFPIGGLPVVPNTSTHDGSRETIWEAGTPTAINTPQTIRTWLNIPKSLQVNGCQGCVRVCFKVEVTDINCNTCEVIGCYTINLMPVSAQPSPICPQNVTMPLNLDADFSEFEMPPQFPPINAENHSAACKKC